MHRKRIRRPPAEPNLALWKHWVTQLTHDVARLLMWREIWGMMAAAINSNPKIPNTLAISYLATTYSQSQAVAVRRLVDSGNDVLSLARLLKSIATTPQLITRESWISQHPQGLDLEFAGPEWDSEFGGSVSVYADPKMVESDLRDLLAEADRVKTLVDKVVAHRVENYSGPLVTQEDLGTAIDNIVRIFRRYYKLLLAQDCNLLPTDLRGVMATFSVPWVDSPTGSELDGDAQTASGRC